MADSPIGEIPILITGDFSELETAITEAASAAEEGASQIADAFDIPSLGDDAVASINEIAQAAEEAASSVSSLSDTGDLSALSDQADDAATSLSELGDAAEGASGSLGDVGGDTGDLSAVSDQADDAATSLSELGDAAEGASGSLEDVGGAAEDGDLSAVSDQADDAATSLSELGNAAEQSSQSINEAGDASSEAGEQAEEAEGGFEGFAEQLLAVGEALAITEGLNELADEAEEAADKITVATIALTAITGSAGLAEETIAGLEEVGTSEGLSMPSLLTAATRMQQMLGSGVNVTELLASIGNGAQAMGTDIVAAAQRFDQMASSGTASARTMMSLGLSLTGLASAINEVTGTEAANEQNAAAMFKAMDQSQRIQVLQTAMEGLAGVAGQVAQQTFGAQWTILANQWETVMVEAGQALLPIVTGLNNLLKTDILPFIQEVATGFNELPGPIRDAAVAAALITTALAAGALAAGALAIPLGALGELLPSIGTLMGTLGLLATQTAAAEGVEAEAAIASAAAHGVEAEALGTEAIAAEGAGLATAEAGAGAAAAGADFAAFGVSLGPVAVGIGAVVAWIAIAHFTGVSAELSDLNTNIKDNASLWSELADELESGVVSGLEAVESPFTAVNSAMTLFIPSLSSLTSGLQGLTQYLPSASSMLETFGEKLLGIPVPLQQLNAALAQSGYSTATMTPLIGALLTGLQAVPPAFAASTAGVAGFSAGLATLVTKQSQANALVDSTKQTMNDAAAALAAGTISQTVYNAAVVAYDNAVQAAIPHGKDFASTVAGIEQAAQKAQQTFQSSLAVYEQLVTGFQDGAVSAGVLDEAYTKLEASAKKAGQTIADSTGILVQWQTQAGQTKDVAEQAAIAMALITTAANDGETSITDLLDVYTKWQAAAKAAGEVSVQSAGQVAQLTNAVLLQEGGLQQNIQAWSDLNKQATTDQAAMVGAQNAFKLVSSEAATLGVNIQQVGSGFQVSAKEATPAANAMVALLVQMMNQAGLTTETIQKGIPVYTDGATGVTVYGKALQQTIGTVVDANTGIVELNAVLPEHADAFNKAAAAAAAHAQALYGVQSAAFNVQPYLFNVTEATQKLTQAGQGTVNTFENAISVFNNLASQTNLTIQQQVALENAFKQVQSAGTALGLQVQFVNGQLVVTSQNGNSASTALQGFLQQINNLTNQTPASTAAQDALAQSIQNVGAAAQQAASDIGSFAQDEAALMGGSGGGTGGGGGSTTEAAGEMLGLEADSEIGGGLITSQEAGAAGMVLTGNNQLETVAFYNAQIEQMVSEFNAGISSTSKYIDQVGSYVDQFGNKIEYVESVLNTDYTPATTAAATATTALATSATAASTAVPVVTSSLETFIQSVDGASAAAGESLQAWQAANKDVAMTVEEQGYVSDAFGTFTGQLSDTSEKISSTEDALGNFTTTLNTTGQSITSAGIPTVAQLEALGLSVTDANNAVQEMTNQQNQAIDQLNAFQSEAGTAASATSSLASAASSAATALSVVQGAVIGAGSTISASTAGATSSGTTTVGGTQLQNEVPDQGGAPPTAPLGYEYQLQNQLVNGQLVPEYTLVQTPSMSSVNEGLQSFSGNGTTGGFITDPNTNVATFLSGNQAALIQQMQASQTYQQSMAGEMLQFPNTAGASGLTATQAALQMLASSSTPSLGSSSPALSMTNSNNTTQTVTINVNAATVVGNNGAQQLAQMIQTAITQTLRQQAGLKL